VSRLDDYLTRMGPLGLIFRTVAPDRQAALLEAVRSAFAPHVAEGEARFTAGCWLIEARARSEGIVRAR